MPVEPFVAELYLLSDVPLSPNYEVTIYFDTPEQQFATFREYKKVVRQNQEIVFDGYYDDLQYIRNNRGYVRLEVKKETIYDCNYMMFKNYNETKWYYAFILDVNYINDNVCEVVFVEDILQTWHFHYTLLPCWIERTHTISDDMFGNLQSEDVNLGDEYVLAKSNAIASIELSSGMCVIIIAAYKLQNETLVEEEFDGHPEYYRKARLINGVYCPCSIFTIPITANEGSYESFYTTMNRIFELLDEHEIVTVYEAPWVFGNAGNTNPYSERLEFGSNPQHPISYETLDGYTPKNKKLYNYPFNLLTINNSAGEVAEYHFENWSNENTRGGFMLRATNFTVPTLIICPTNYRGFQEDWESGIGFSNFPPCAWNGDAFKCYLAQHMGLENVGNAFPNPLKMGSYPWSVASDITGSMHSGAQNIASSVPITAPVAVAQAAQSLLTTVGGLIGQWNDLQRIPNQTYGQARYNNILLASGHLKITFAQKCIKRQYLKVIDDYFTRFGYSIKHIAVPNRKNRPYFTYIKTVGCQISGKINPDTNEKMCPPASVMRGIEHIFDTGITYWVGEQSKLNKFGDFIGVNNSPE